MKRVLYSVVCLLSICAVIFGNRYYHHKLEQTAKAAKLKIGKTSAAEGSSPVSHPRDGNTKKLTKNFPDPLKKIIQAKIKKGEPVKLAIIGSADTSEDPGSWVNQLKQKLDERYGEGVFDVTAKGFKDDWSITIAENKEYKDVIETKPDILLIEPFLLNDSGEIRVEDTLGALGIIIDDFKKKSPKMTVMVQPSVPIYKPQGYAEQVAELKTYAKKNGLIYVNHWDNWPDPNSEKIKAYYDKDSLPNEKGNRAWAEYLGDYFTGN
ncbi:SGNH/GDSL hydrolase family protein [Fictibacillus gelatini]|uniref:SGNH/GDSL hydrolase family protein n=1 Tax=Fictibacillus gelatini TaxID=225985 RepID=UPI00041BB41E|nr:SGNH/GDSL hydrolase family protein [Fictibacillus gelatini]